MELTEKVKEFFTKDLHISRFCVDAKVSRRTFLRRKKNPDGFTAPEIKVIKKLVKVQDIFKK